MIRSFILFVAATIFLNATGNCQTKPETGSGTSDTVVVTGSEYIPIEGRIVPGVRADLQGKWILKSGIQPEKPKVDMDLLKTPTPGTEIRRDTVTTSQTVNGVTTTTTEVEYDKIKEPEKQITPPQGKRAHIPERPSISFFGANETFTGFTGCNKFSGRFILEGNNLNMQNAAASTKMACIGEYDENAFLDALHRVNSFRNNNGELEFLDGDKVLLVFSRK